MKKFIYNSVVLIVNPLEKDIDSMLNRYGDDGWEVCAMEKSSPYKKNNMEHDVYEVTFKKEA